MKLLSINVIEKHNTHGIIFFFNLKYNSSIPQRNSKEYQIEQQQNSEFTFRMQVFKNKILH